MDGSCFQILSNKFTEILGGFQRLQNEMSSSEKEEKCSEVSGISNLSPMCVLPLYLSDLSHISCQRPPLQDTLVHGVCTPLAQSLP